MAKATHRAYALGAVLHNRRVLTEARRVVLLAVIRLPIVEWASTVWHPTGAAAKRVEEVMVRVLRRFIRVGCNAAVEILHLEFGCRPFSSWMRQRVLEFAFRLGRMPAERLPAQVAAARWPLQQGSKRPQLHEHRLTAAERVTAVSVAASVATTSCSYAMFEQQAATAVRRADLAAIHAALQTRGRKSTVARYLDILGGDLADGRYMPGLLAWPHWMGPPAQVPLQVRHGSCGPPPVHHRAGCVACLQFLWRS